MILAHVAGLPVEEILPTLAGSSSGALVVRGWLKLRLKHRRKGNR